MAHTFLLQVIKTYRSWVSPFLGPQCRFEPTCSHYAYDSIRFHGLVRGIGLTVIRLLKCHPFHPGGIDPVPYPGSSNCPHS